MHLKIVNASQGHTHEYENIKRKLYSCNLSYFMIHIVMSPQLYILWPKDGPVQRPKYVVSLNKDNIR